MKEDEVFAAADMHLGEKYNRGKVKALADHIYGQGFSAGASAARTMYADIAAALKASAKKECRGCDGTGIFYGNVHVCPCTFDTHDTDVLVRRLVAASKLHTLFVGADQGHLDHMHACRRALVTYRIEFESPGVRYWYHAESESIVTTVTQEEVDRMFDGPEDLTEISRQEAQKHLKAELEKRVTRNPGNPFGLPEDDEEL